MAPRKVPKADKTKGLDKALKGMFGKLQRRPVPDDLLSIVDQLEEAQKTPPKKASAG